MSAWRAAVIARDLGCVAPRVDQDAGDCFDSWGGAIDGQADLAVLEADYVRRGARGARHELASDHVALCPGHHRGTGPSAGHIWATARRRLLREYLNSQEET